MSRGPGKLQREIFAFLQQYDGPVTLENLRWELRKNRDSPNLTKSWSFAVERAVRNMASPKRGLLTVEKRRLVSLAEWVKHYPDKTLDGTVRQLRLDLLPHLADWLAGKRSPGPKFTPDENERFAFRGRRGGHDSNLSEEFRHRHSPEWKTLEPHIWQELRAAPNDTLFHLLVRGRQLFTSSRVQTALSFRDILKQCADEKLLPHAVLAQFQSFADRVFPPTKAGFLALKSLLYQSIQPVRIRQPELKADALKALVRAKPDYMKTVAGFNPPPPRTKGMFILPEDQRWQNAVAKGTPLARLVDHSAFQQFGFLRIKP